MSISRNRVQNVRLSKRDRLLHELLLAVRRHPKFGSVSSTGRQCAKGKLINYRYSTVYESVRRETSCQSLLVSSCFVAKVRCRGRKHSRRRLIAMHCLFGNPAGSHTEICRRDSTLIRKNDLEDMCVSFNFNFSKSIIVLL